VRPHGQAAVWRRLCDPTAKPLFGSRNSVGSLRTPTLIRPDKEREDGSCLTKLTWVAALLANAGHGSQRALLSAISQVGRKLLRSVGLDQYAARCHASLTV
jgi:hypothetical protein